MMLLGYLKTSSYIGTTLISVEDDSMFDETNPHHADKLRN